MATTDPSGCCPDHLALELGDVTNAPGQARLNRRIGTYSRFRDRLEAELSRHTPTTGLTTREPDDFAIALLHAWATVADNVTFYTERIANENYVGTAVERRSMNELARLIGRTLQPGLAAEADLAFTMDSTLGAPDRLELGIGAAVQSEPEPGGEPAIYETVESREIRPAWNRLRARSTLGTAAFGTGTPRLHLTGTSTGVRVGDMVAYAAGGGKPVVAVVTSVEAIDAVPPKPDDAGRPARTVIEIDQRTQVDTGLNGNGLLSDRGSTPSLSGVAGWLNGRTITASVLEAEAAERRVEMADVEASLSGRTPTYGWVTVFRLSTSMFGAAAPASASLASAVESELVGLDDTALTEALEDVSLAPVFTWDTDTAADIPSAKDILLDTSYPTVTEGSVVALTTATAGGVYRVNQASIGGYAAGGISGKTTRLGLSSSTAQSGFPIRTSAVAAQSERLELAPRPWPALILFTSVQLEALELGLSPGRMVVVSGAAHADPGRIVNHVTELAEVTHDFGDDRHTTITLATALPEFLIRDTVTVNANVVRASHGLTRSDVLGSGDGRRRFQKFTLADEPLTYLSSSTPSGRVTTLRIFVDDLEWYEVDQLPGHVGDERIFVTRSTGAGTVVQFGDGLTGARLPTGIANVRAAYRVGAGKAGRVGADRLTTLASRPAGLNGVTNPTASEGGAEPETADQARSNVAVQVRTLGRVVSLRDYEDFARSFSGVAKARATWGRSGRSRGIIVTVAGDDGDAIAPGTPIHDSLIESFAAAGDSLVPVHLVPHRPRTFRVAADLRIRADHQRDLVHAAVDEVVRSEFAFDRRGLGDSVFASEILETMHDIAGVVAADLTLFAVVTGAGTAAGVPDVLHASAPQPGLLLSGAATSIGAELLTIETRSILLGDLP